MAHRYQENPFFRAIGERRVRDPGGATAERLRELLAAVPFTPFRIIWRFPSGTSLDVRSHVAISVVLDDVWLGHSRVGRVSDIAAIEPAAAGKDGA